jgi:hypothetical protein
MISAKDVSAVIVTRGDVDLSPILATLPYEDVVVWDNSKRKTDEGIYGRYLAIKQAKSKVIYFQDDDLLFTAHDELIAAYEPGKIVANMPSPWYERESYDELGCALVGAGALVPRALPQKALARYLKRYPLDDLFRTYCDIPVGILSPSKRVDLGYEILPCATAPNRVNLQPGQLERKRAMQRRAVEIRDGI